MEKEFVSYEQAVALKELGLKDKCIATIENNGYVHIKGTRGLPSAAAVVNKVDAPLKQQVFRWFREKYDLSISVSGTHFNAFYLIHVPQKCDSADGRPVIKWDYIVDKSRKTKTYEEAENACIDKLILTAKQQDNENI